MYIVEYVPGNYVNTLYYDLCICIMATFFRLACSTVDTIYYFFK